MSNNVRTLPDDFSHPEDTRRLKAQQLQIEFMRDFIVWLCEVECDSTVSELEEKFKDDVAKLEWE